MWFRNLQIYRLLVPIDLSPEELHDKLSEKAFRPCGTLEPETMGWDQPLGRDGSSLTHAANGFVMVCARREERLLPSSVVKETLDDRVAAIEDKEGRVVRRKEKLQLKDEVVLDLMPKAFTRSSRTFAYIDTNNGYIVVDNAAAKRAEMLLTLLRDSLGTLKVVPLAMNDDPSAVMTGWISNTAPADFNLLDECELREPSEEGGIIRCKRQDLHGSEVSVHLEAGKRVVRLAVEWNERIGCILGNDLAVRRLRLLDIVQEEAADAFADDAAARFDVDFSLMTLELSRFIPRMVEVFGGLAED